MSFLALTKTIDKTVPRSVAKWNICKGVSVVSGLVTSEPSFREEFIRISKVVWVHGGKRAIPDHHGSFGDSEASNSDVLFKVSGGPKNCRENSLALKLNSFHVLHLGESGLC